jgi:hypothetical protein
MSSFSTLSMAVIGFFLLMSVIFAIMFVKSTYQEIRISEFADKNSKNGFGLSRSDDNLTVVTKFGEFSEACKLLVSNSSVESLPQILQKIYLIFLIERVLSSCLIVILAPIMSFISAVIATI